MGLHKVHVDDGVVKKGSRRSSSKRFSKPALLKNRLVLAIKRLNKGFILNHQGHHLIPDGVVRKSDLLREAIERGIFDIDSVKNGVLLPADSTASKVYRHPDWGGLADLPIHYTSHPKYNDFATAVLDQALDDLTASGRVGLGELSPARIEKAIHSVQESLIEFLMSPESKIQTGTRKGELAAIEKDAGDAQIA